MSSTGLGIQQMPTTNDKANKREHPIKSYEKKVIVNLNDSLPRICIHSMR